MRVKRAIHADSDERGAALILSLILVMVCAALGAAFTQVASTSARKQSHEVKQLQAFYLAEAGLAEAFLAVRMGRTGDIGAEAAPATFGDGSIFVESVRTEDRRVFLRASAQKDLSTAVLGLIVKPPEPPLGFFAREDLIVESVLLVDGFDSTERSYAEEVQVVQGAITPAPKKGDDDDDSIWSEEQVQAFENARSRVGTYVDRLTQPVLETVLANQIDLLPDGTHFLYFNPIDIRPMMSVSEYDDFLEHGRDIYSAFNAGVLFSDRLVLPESSIALSSQWLQLGWASVPAESEERLEMHTLKGGVLGSNGDIYLNGDAADGEIHGSLVPGVDGVVHGTSEDAVSGATDSRAMPAEFAPVIVPGLTSLGDRTVGSGMPEVVSGTDVRYGTLAVESSQDLILRGPMTLVLDRLEVADDALVTLDTAHGSVEIFVTDSIQMSPNAVVQTTSDSARDVSIKASGETGAASTIDLSAISQFHGTIYAPDSDVSIGSNFEIFGSVVARRLTIGAGARLHFDHEGYNGNQPIPQHESWRILELPDQPERGAPQVEAAGALTLSRAHRIETIELDIDFVDQTGIDRSYSGFESDFDYANVSAVSRVSRRPAAAETPDEERGSWWDSWGKAAAEWLKEKFSKGRKG